MRLHQTPNHFLQVIGKILTSGKLRIIFGFICLSAFSISVSAQAKFVFNDNAAKDRNVATLAPTPILVSGNPSCSDLNNSANPQYNFIISDHELKLDFTPPGGNSGPYPITNGGGRVVSGGPQDPSNSVSLQNVRAQTGTDDDTFDFTATRPISAVIVKGGPNANVYLYPSTTLGGNPDGLGLTTPGIGPEISHISFCLAPAATVTIIKEVQTFNGGTSSTTSFPFSAFNLGTLFFNLVDDDAGPGVAVFTNNNVMSFGGGANTITVTEGLVAGWTLADIECKETLGQDTTITFGSRRANIVAEPGETIICTFKNLQLQVTAAGARLSGRVMTDGGVSIRNALVSIYDGNTLETRVTRTDTFGYYSIGNLEVGHLYMVTVSHGKYNFPIQHQSFVLNEDLTDVNFISTDSPVTTGLSDEGGNKLQK